MLLQFSEFSHNLCLNNFPQVWLICNQIDQVPPLRYIDSNYEVSHLVRGGEVIGDMKYLMRSVKLVAGAVGNWAELNWDVKIVNLLYTMVSGGFNLKRNKRFDSLSWPLVVRYLYKRRGYIIRELNWEQKKSWKAQKNKRYISLFPSGFLFY